MIAHCLFEQSGHFKHAFQRAGVEARDYDIQDEYGETDVVIDLFAEIRKAYEGEPSIFDEMAPDDILIAFFPCIYFCEASELQFRMEYARRFALPAKMYHSILARNDKRAEFLALFIKLCAVADMRGLRLIVENPYSADGFLARTKPLRPPALIDMDRTQHGDFFRKPTAFWCVNFRPGAFQKILTPRHLVRRVRETKGSGTTGICSAERSMISEVYADNFVRNVVLRGRPT